MIFCVEDDSGIRDLMIYTLSAAGFETEGFADGKELNEALKKKIPDLIMLDIMLPGEDGLSILKRIRKNSYTAGIPVIMATAKGTEYDKVIGLDCGADDYLAKPFGMMEMLSRVKAVLRRTAPKNNKPMLTNGEISINTAEHTAEADGKRICLTLKEYELLQKFMENPGIVFSREQLLHSIWGAEYIGETRTVDVHIGTLRTKLGKCGDYIETVRGVGYRLEAHI
ncbi:MAG: response regulator transcription factor [Oscillospiraceae bacterium]|nr:response regulator transcription factor [Oscillospiraceae bacterium]